MLFEKLLSDFTVMLGTFVLPASDCHTGILQMDAMVYISGQAINMWNVIRKEIVVTLTHCSILSGEALLQSQFLNVILDSSDTFHQGCSPMWRENTPQGLAEIELQFVNEVLLVFLEHPVIEDFLFAAVVSAFLR